MLGNECTVSDAGGPDTERRWRRNRTAGAAACTALGDIVHTGHGQCCSSIHPQLPPPTYYGAAMLRENDPRGVWTPHLAVPADPPGTIEEMQRRVDEQEKADFDQAGDTFENIDQLPGFFLSRYKDRPEFDESFFRVKE